MIDNSINGSTRLLGIIGDPIEHTFSPIIHNSISHAEKRNVVYVPFHVLKDNLENAVNAAFSLGILGLNVTVPHKKNVMSFISHIDEKALQIGAVNTLKYTEDGYAGYNTDILGIKQSLESESVSLKDKKVLILGAGGAACPAAVLAASEGASNIFIANRTLKNAEDLKDNVIKHYNVDVQALSLDDINSIDSCDIIIQTTTLGFGKNEGISPVNDTSFFNSKGVSLVFDAVYAPWKTKLLQDAESAGCKCINGFPMLVYQAAASYEIWFDTECKKNVKDLLANQLSAYYKAINNIIS